MRKGTSDHLIPAPGKRSAVSDKPAVTEGAWTAYWNQSLLLIGACHHRSALLPQTPAGLIRRRLTFALAIHRNVREQLAPGAC